MRFNIIGFGPEWRRCRSSRWHRTKFCIVHQGTPLVSKLDEAGVLWCPLCGGSSYVELEKDKED